MSRGHRTLCPECRYPMLELKDFQGASSRDAPGFGGKDAYDYGFWGWWAIAHDVLEDVWRGLRSVWRKRKVKRLRADILPHYPNTLICPQCLHVIKKS